jgi:hypothetical protein
MAFEFVAFFRWNSIFLFSSSQNPPNVIASLSFNWLQNCRVGRHCQGRSQTCSEIETKLTMTSQWRRNAVAMPWQWCHNDVTMTSQWCYNDVAMMLQWRRNDVTMTSECRQPEIETWSRIENTVKSHQGEVARIESGNRVARFSWYNLPKREKIYQVTKNIPNGQKYIKYL